MFFGPYWYIGGGTGTIIGQLFLMMIEMTIETLPAGENTKSALFNCVSTHLCSSGSSNVGSGQWAVI